MIRCIKVVLPLPAIPMMIQIVGTFWCFDGLADGVSDEEVVDDSDVVDLGAAMVDIQRCE